MKFASAATLLFATLLAYQAPSGESASIKGSSSSPAANDNKKQDSRNLSHSEDGSCPTCNALLPGYTFFGPQYLEKKFWEDFGTIDIDFGNDLLTINDGICYSGPGAYFTCGALAWFAEAIYTSDVLRCLLMSLSGTARDLTCMLQDIEGIPNPDVLGEPYPPAPPVRKLSYDTGSEAIYFLKYLLKLLKYENFEGLLELFELKEPFCEAFGADYQYSPFYNYCHHYYKNRELSPDLRSGDEIGEIIDDVLFAVFDADGNQALTAFAFELKCADAGADLVFCGAVYSLYKTIDAAVCHATKEDKCSVTDTCTDDLKFTTEYNARSAARYLPDAGGLEFLIADIIAPCTTCAISDNKCSGFCTFAQNHHQCDIAKRFFFQSALEADPDAAGDLLDDLRILEPFL